ncbi:PREDICTED: uncharacterized protein LOC109206227 isoform X1 [Nicotiana attenuata]|uniref:uncharacterized protein LOC109206227 isoform X1 n=1 Tax=Nicotiana attenuata TaxID=49451 RepID=UPI000904BF15|nr:PREDICTED: uncharacterized protein LOC109206227 isoform X1 [Nicotiana attenuata]
MREDNDMNGKGDSCCIDGNSKSVNPITDAGAGAGAGAGGTGSGNGEVEGVSSSNNKGKSCKGCLYYSSTFKSNSRNPLCLGLSRSLPQVPRYIVGESEMEASKEGRSLTDFRYACVGYSVYLDQKSRSTDAQETQTELPVCVGLEVLVDKRPSSADAAPAPAHAHAQKKEGLLIIFYVKAINLHTKTLGDAVCTILPFIFLCKMDMEFHSLDHINQLMQLVMSSLPGLPGMLTWLQWE